MSSERASADAPTPGRTCPHCDRPFAFRMRERIDDGFGVTRYYRHHGPRGYVYFHEIVYEPTPAADANGAADR